MVVRNEAEGAVFTYDFTRFDAEKILPMFAKYKITTFCAPPTMYRMLIKEDISKCDYYKDEARTDEAWRGGVSAAPRPVRGQVVKATIRLVKGTEPTEELKKDVQNYVKSHAAPYKYPRIVVFRDELPKTISGKIQRNKL